MPPSTLFISTDSVCVVTKNPCYVHYKAYFISFLSQCFHKTELSSRLSKAWKCSLPLVYGRLDVSPTYFDLQAWQTNSYVTHVLRHDPFPSVRQRRQSAFITHRFCLKGSDLCSMTLRVVRDCSTTLILKSVALISLMYRLCLSWEPGVAGTKITVSKPPFLNQLSRGGPCIISRYFGRHISTFCLASTLKTEGVLQ